MKMDISPTSSGVLGPQPAVHETAQIQGSSLGDYTEIGPGCEVLESAIGNYSYLSPGCDVAYTDMGKFVSVASSVRIGPTNHPVWRATQHHFTYRSSKYGLGPDDEEIFEWRRRQRTTIGHDAWIGHGAIILPGVSIGTGAVVAAGAVVSKDVAPYTIVGGVPGKRIKVRFEHEIAHRLTRLAWWDWPHERLGSALADFRALSVEAFLEKYEGDAPTL